MAKDNKKKQEEQQQQQSWDNLNRIFSSASTQASKTGAAGNTVLDDVTKYFKSLIGDRTSAAQAVAPATNAARAQGDAAKHERAETGTARTGGDAASNQEIDDKVRAAIDTLIGGAGPAAAGELKGIGESEVNNMLNALGIGTIATGTVGSQVSSDLNSRREASAAMWSALIGGGASLAGAMLGKPSMPTAPAKRFSY